MKKSAAVDRLVPPQWPSARPTWAETALSEKRGHRPTRSSGPSARSAGQHERASAALSPPGAHHTRPAKAHRAGQKYPNLSVLFPATVPGQLFKSCRYPSSPPIKPYNQRTLSTQWPQILPFFFSPVIAWKTPPNAAVNRWAHERVSFAHDSHSLAAILATMATDSLWQEGGGSGTAILASLASRPSAGRGIGRSVAGSTQMFFCKLNENYFYGATLPELFFKMEIISNLKNNN